MSSAERSSRHHAARRAHRICMHHGCRKRVKGASRCDEHAEDHAAAEKERRKKRRLEVAPS